MSIFSSLLNTAKNFVTNAFSSSKQSASAINSVPQGYVKIPTLNNPTKNIESSFGGQSTVAAKIPQQNSILLPQSLTRQVAGMNVPTGTVNFGQAPTSNQASPIIQPVLSANPYQIPTARPSTATLGGTMQGPYAPQSESSNYMQPRQEWGTAPDGSVYAKAFSGGGGESGGTGGLSFTAAPQSGTAGAGGSAYTGILQGTSGLTTPSVNRQSMNPDEEDALTTKKKGLVNQTTPMLPLGIMGPTTQAPNFSFSPSGNEFDAGQLQKSQKDNAEALNSSQALSADDRAETYSQIETLAQQSYANQQATPEIPVVESPEQRELMYQLPPEEQFNFKQEYDKLYEQSGKAEAVAQRIEVQKQLNATNEAFSKITDDVKNNPDLPKGLALRRIQDIQKTQKDRIMQLTGQLDILNQQVEDADTYINQQYGIVKDQQAQERQAKQDALARANLMISSGGIGGASDSDIAVLSQQTGIPSFVFKDARNSANNPKEKIEGNLKDGLYKLVTDKSGKTRVEVIQEGIEEEKLPTQAQYVAAGFASRLEQSGSIIDKNEKAFASMNPVSFEAQKRLPSYMQTATFQSQDQAERNFVNAQLRRESGAVISPTEFDNASKQYFPRPGDTLETLQQKRDNRLLVTQNLIRASGSAYESGLLNVDPRLMSLQKNGISADQLNNALSQGYTVDDVVNHFTQTAPQVKGYSSGQVVIPQSSRLAYVNNNPGNLRFAGQPGAQQGEGGFAKFSSPTAGYEALVGQIQLDAKRGLTLDKFINKYAPPSENDTKSYIKQIASMTGAKATTPISQIDINALAKAIAKKESSTIIQ